MANLPTGQSLRTAALEISRNVAQLTGLEAVSTLVFDADDRAIPLAIVSADGAEHYHPTLADERSRYLRQRASGGPWIEAWDGTPGEPVTWLEATAENVQVARLPVRTGGLVVGLVAAFAAGQDAESRLTDLLPALGEFADLSGLILGGHLEELAAASPGRERIDALISAAAFRPVFQPVVDLETLEMVGFEALTRFDSGEPPGAIFAEAWSVGLGPGLEMATLGAAIGASVELPAGRWLSVNLSPQLITHEHALAEIMAALDRPLVIEITEHQSVPDPLALRAAIRSLGPNVRLAVDDAGAGVANFGHIVGLRPDFVKLDIGLVKGIHRDVGRQALMVGMRHFARSAGCRLIAEGIESAAEADTVAALGCEFGQGHLFGAAQPAGNWVTGVVALLLGDAGSGHARPAEVSRGAGAAEDG
jgi:EAL domain-containing protein (putative c-di-GMP-specific phosphodiesterase class I)